MSNQRKAGKTLLGAHLSGELWSAIEVWLDRHPGAYQTDFLIEAVILKLKQEKIAFDEYLARARGAPRRRKGESAYALNDAPAPEIKPSPRKRKP